MKVIIERDGRRFEVDNGKDEIDLDATIAELFVPVLIAAGYPPESVTRDLLDKERMKRLYGDK